MRGGAVAEWAKAFEKENELKPKDLEQSLESMFRENATPYLVGGDHLEIGRRLAPGWLRRLIRDGDDGLKDGHDEACRSQPRS